MVILLTFAYPVKYNFENSRGKGKYIEFTQVFLTVFFFHPGFLRFYLFILSV